MTMKFKSLIEAEAFLVAVGFKRAPDSCDWRNEAGDDAGCYAIYGGHYGVQKGFRVEINLALAETDQPPRRFDDTGGCSTPRTPVVARLDR